MVASMVPVLEEQLSGETQLGVEVHLWVYHYRNGVLISSSHHAGVLTNIGKDFIEQQISGTPNASKAVYISCSNDTSSPVAGWYNIPAEITTDGLSRALGTYSSTGVGTWNVTNAFTVTGTNSTQLYGLSISAAPAGGLIASDTSTQKDVSSGDTLTVTWQVTVT